MPSVELQQSEVVIAAACWIRASYGRGTSPLCDVALSSLALLPSSPYLLFCGCFTWLAIPIITELGHP